MMKQPHSPNLVEIGSWGPEIWSHEYLSSPIEVSVNWPGSSSNLHFMCKISCKIWCVRVYHVLLKYGNENGEMQNQKFDDVTFRYSIGFRLFVGGCVFGSGSKLIGCYYLLCK